MNNRTATAPLRLLKRAPLSTVVLAGCLCINADAFASSFETGAPDLKIRWDNTVKYSAGFRVLKRADAIMADANVDDGDRNFNRGLMSNRVDLLSELDVTYKNFGARLSGAAWYDDVYNRRNDNHSPSTSNNVSVSSTEFTRGTRNRMGRKAELLDSFIYAKGDLGDMPTTVRLGSHTLLFGESVFFGSNGIAAAQGPVDLVKLLSIPSSQFKEVLRPVQQLSGQIQMSKDLSVSAYYQYRSEKTILPPAGSYLSSSDIVGDGAERAGPFLRAPDISAKNSGQGGIQLRTRLTDWDAEVSVFAARYHDKTPNLYLTLDPLTFAPASLRHVYAEGIRTYGASLSTVAGPLNLAAEASVRTNAPLVSDPLVIPEGSADNHDRPAYAVGKTLHAQISGVYLLNASSLWQGGSLLGELAWNRRASIDQNPGALDPNTTRDAVAMRMVFTPNYYQVLPSVDISVPIGFGYTIKGRSSAVSSFGPEHGGDFSIGVTGDYAQEWQFGVSYTHFLGRKQATVLPPNAAQQYLSFSQPLRDRNFISLNIKRTF